MACTATRLIVLSMFSRFALLIITAFPQLVAVVPVMPINIVFPLAEAMVAIILGVLLNGVGKLPKSTVPE